ncbi:hypothetical protein [Rhizobium mulingense]|uniref:hypothetical protein n=1 Tax=Rhizobium mulingense TaxID=3031128 RepID=UPI002B496D98|nr:hypothetical protein [Rhizobium sp. MJ21]MEB3046829.1 hypothetical protein [Rhizobium sp. MJ21]
MKKRLILYRERQYSEFVPIAQSIKDNTNVIPASLAKEVQTYLSRGLVLIEFISPTPDPYCPTDLVRNVVFSDGVYFWDGILLHWVENYRVRMPEEFMAHFDSAKSRPMPVDESDVERLLTAFKIAEPLMVT